MHIIYRMLQNLFSSVYESGLEQANAPSAMKNGSRENKIFFKFRKLFLGFVSNFCSILSFFVRDNQLIQITISILDISESF